MPTAPATRTVKILCRGHDLVLIRVSEPARRSEQVQDYWLEKVATDFGHAWTWRHFGGRSHGKTYRADPSAKTCDCKHGIHRRRGQEPCRHLAGTDQLIRDGKLS